MSHSSPVEEMRPPVERAFPNRISHMAMIDRLELAIVRDYDELRVALRARCEQLNISRLEIDRLSGLPNGYASTVLSNAPRKRIGPAWRWWWLRTPKRWRDILPVPSRA